VSQSLLNETEQQQQPKKPRQKGLLQTIGLQLDIGRLTGAETRDGDDSADEVG
jgi:hypothetical protein